MRLSIVLACCLPSAPAFADCVPTHAAPICTYYERGQTIVLRMLMPRPDKICAMVHVRAPSGPLPVFAMPYDYPVATSRFEAKEKGKYDFRFTIVRADSAYRCEMRRPLLGGGHISVVKPWILPPEPVHHQLIADPTP